MNTRLYITLLSLFSVLQLSAFNLEWKKGYIITNGNDTIRGLVAIDDIGESHLRCLFRESSRDIVHTYSPYQIAGYSTEDGLAFASFIFESSAMAGEFFLQSLFQGSVDLYYVSVPAKEIHTYVFKRRDTGTITTAKMPGQSSSPALALKRLRNTLQVLLKDCPEIERDVKRNKGGRDEMIQLFTRYHEIICDENSCIMYAEKKPTRLHYLTPLIGIGWNRISENRYSDPRIWHTCTAPSIGVDYATNIERFNSIWLFHAAVDVSYFELENTTAKGKRYTGYSSFNLRNDLYVEWRFMRVKAKPSLHAGFSHQLFMPSDNTPWEGKNYKYSTDDYYGAVMLGAGFVIPVNEKQEMPVRFDFRAPIFHVVKERSKSFYLNTETAIAVSVGYRFEL